MLAIGIWPEGIDAISFLPAPLLTSDLEKLPPALIRFSTPMGASYPITPSMLGTVASGLRKVGNQLTRLARQIFHGGEPAETADFTATLSLKTAQATGLTAPDDLRLIRSPARHRPFQQILKAIAAIKITAA
jgi:hypothetical protein